MSADCAGAFRDVPLGQGGRSGPSAASGARPAAPNAPEVGRIVSSPPTALVPALVAAAQPQKMALLSGGSEESADQVFIDWLADEGNTHDS